MKKVALILLASLTSSAYAANLTNVFNSFSDMGNSLVTLISTFATVGGIGVFCWGLWEWYQSGNQQSQVRAKQYITKILAGAALFVAPTLISYTSNQIAGSEVSGEGKVGSKGKDVNNW